MGSEFHKGKRFIQEVLKVVQDLLKMPPRKTVKQWLSCFLTIWRSAEE